jgi:hypothetical protein
MPRGALDHDLRQDLVAPACEIYIRAFVAKCCDVLRFLGHPINPSAGELSNADWPT